MADLKIASRDDQPATEDVLIDEARMGEYCLARTREQLRAHDLAAVLLFDPCNVRYTTTGGPMTVYMLHNPDRFALIPVASSPVLWEHRSVMHLPNSWQGATRPAPSWRAFGSGSLSPIRARAFASQIADELQTRGLLGERIGVDRLDAAGFLALLEAGIQVVDGQLPMEIARSVKGPDEIAAMRASAHVCDTAIEALRDACRPGATENAIWGMFNGTAFALGAEYNETRLLTSGPRTNPWFQEASMRTVSDGDLVAFDTDLVGPRGYLIDISRTYLCGSRPPTANQRQLYAMAYEFLQNALPLFRPGASFEDLGTTLAARIPTEFHDLRYPVIAHGVGLADEYPAILFDDHHPGVVELNMILSVEIYLGRKGDHEGVKLEEQILITDTGYEIFSQAPFDERLLS